MNDLLATLSLIVTVGLLVALFICTNKMDNMKAEAVKRGYAEWISDYYGNSTFQWK
jgi:hypothetical protein